MDTHWRAILWQQFGAAIDMLENAMRACPDQLWSDRTRNPEFWYLAFHTLFFLDLYPSNRMEGFAPPAPFTMDELLEGRLPERVYSKEELRSYLAHGREKNRAAIDALTDESAQMHCEFEWLKGMSVVELMLYNMRHVQHHAAQLNLILRQVVDSAPPWVSRST